jgi:hypothetical protein
MKTDYNGWTNYATWRVNLEIIDGIEIETQMCAATIKEIVEDVVFISEVNFYEIAQSINEEIDLQTEYDN